MDRKLDIFSIPNRKMSDEEEVSINYFVQLDLFQTGYYYYTDEETKKLLDKLKAENKPIARVNLKINNMSLLDEKLSNEVKQAKAKKIVNKIRELQGEAEKKKTKKISSMTNVSFFDIDYKTILDLIIKENKVQNLTSHEELQLLHQNISLLSHIFGFKFQSPKTMVQINNQSLIHLENVFPEIKQFQDQANKKNLLEIEENLKKEDSTADKLKKDENFHLMNSTSDIIDIDEGFLIEEHLPEFLKGITWRLLYSRIRDGTSYNTLQRNTHKKGTVLILVQNEQNEKFGGLFTHSFEYSSGFFGTGEAFLFRFFQKTLKVYKSSFRNSLYCFADEDGFGMGSDNHYGLFVEKNLRNGSSHTCKTYLNDPLSSEPHFEVKKLEIWGFAD